MKNFYLGTCCNLIAKRYLAKVINPLMKIYEVNFNDVNEWVSFNSIPQLEELSFLDWCVLYILTLKKVSNEEFLHYWNILFDTEELKPYIMLLGDIEGANEFEMELGSKNTFDELDIELNEDDYFHILNARVILWETINTMGDFMTKEMFERYTMAQEVLREIMQS